MKTFYRTKELFKLEIMLKYGYFKKKYYQFLKKYTGGLYIFVWVIRALLLILSMVVLTILMKIGYIKIEYLYLVSILLLLSITLTLKYTIILVDEQLKLRTYITSNLFSDKEKSENLMAFCNYIWIKNLLFFIVIISYITLIQNCLLNNSQIHIQFLFNINILLIISIILYLKVFYFDNNLSYKCNKKNKEINIFSFFIGTIIFIITKNKIFTLDSLYNLKFLSLLNKTITLTSNFAMHKHSVLSNLLVFTFLIFIQIILILFVKKHNKKIHLFNNMSQIRSRRILHFIETKYTFIVRDFIIKEVIEKISFIPIIMSILLLINISDLKKNIVLVILMSFLFTQYNQRYLLRSAVFSYFKLVNDYKHCIISIIYKLLPLQICIIIVTTILINSMTNISEFLMYIGINVIVFLLILSVNTFIMIVGSSRKEDYISKCSIIEIVSGGFYISILLLLRGAF